MAAPTAANWDATTVQDALKEYYAQPPIANAPYTQSKLVLLNPAKFKLRQIATAGYQHVQAIRVAQSDGLGMDVTTANAAARDGYMDRWVVQPRKIYKSDRIGTDVLYMANGDPKGAFFSAAKDILNWSRNDLVVELERRLFGDGTGSIGTVGSVASNTITLGTAADVRNFERGMSIRDSSTNVTQVTEVNRSAGTITVAATTGFTVAGTVIYRYGFYQSSAASGHSGLSRLFPTTRTAGTDYLVHGVYVNADFDRLAGTFVDKTGSTPYEALMDGALRSKSNGADPTAIIMSHENLASLMNDVQGQRSFESADAATVGFRTVSVVIPDGGSVKVLGSQFCSSNQMYLLNEQDLTLVYWGKNLINIQDTDGSILHWNNDADAWSIRHLTMCNLFANTPSLHAVIKL